MLVGSTDRFLYAFPAAGCGAATCKPRWRGKLRDAPEASVTIAGGVAHLGDFGGRLYAFPVSGCGQAVCAPFWTGKVGPNLELNNTPAVGGGHVFIGALSTRPTT